MFMIEGRPGSRNDRQLGQIVGCVLESTARGAAPTEPGWPLPGVRGPRSTAVAPSTSPSPVAGETQPSNGNAYQYDAFNQMARYTSGSEDWVYTYGPDDERFWSYRTAGGGSLWTMRRKAG
jgi:hypothetical protein